MARKICIVLFVCLLGCLFVSLLVCFVCGEDVGVWVGCVCVLGVVFVCV